MKSISLISIVILILKECFVYGEIPVFLIIHLLLDLDGHKISGIVSKANIIILKLWLWSPVCNCTVCKSVKLLLFLNCR